MSDKLTNEEKGALDGAIRQLMTPEAAKEINLNPSTQQFLIRFLDLRDEVISDKLKEWLKQAQEEKSDDLCKDIAEVVAAQNRRMFTSLKEQTTLLSGISDNIALIQSDITNIKDRLLIIEKKQKTDEDKIADMEEDLEELNEKIELVQPDRVEQLINELEIFEPKMKSLIVYSSWWSTITRIVLAMIIGLLIVWYIHKNFWSNGKYTNGKAVPQTEIHDRPNVP
jgi:hypothetical protein